MKAFKFHLKILISGFLLIAIPKLINAQCPTFDDPESQNGLLELMNIPCAWDITEGGETICIYDSYLDDTHPDLYGKVVAIHEDFGDCDPAMASYHHGIQSFGAAAGIRDNGLCVAGSGGKNTKVAGYCRAADAPALLDAIDKGYKIISISAWYGGISRSVFEELVKNDITVLIAGLANHHQPYQDVPGVIHVGRAYTSGNWYPYQSGNQNFDVLAITQGMNRIIEGNNCGPSGEGTSIGTPVVAGVVSLMKSVNPCLFPSDIEEILVATAAPIPGNADSTITRAGIINAEAAVIAAQNFTGFDQIINSNVDFDHLAVSGDLTLNEDVHVTINVDGILTTGQESTVTIKKGASLTIKGTAKMGDLSRIIVKRGGKLEVNNGEISARQGCGAYWKGIIVEGSSAVPQNTTIDGRTGIVIIKNNSKIKNARTAVSMNPSHIPWPQTRDYYGGYVKIDNSEFTDNVRALAFMKYRFRDNSNIRNSDFIRHDLVATHWDNFGTYYLGNYFGEYRRHAIYCSDSSIRCYSNSFDGSSIFNTQDATIQVSYTNPKTQSCEIGRSGRTNHFYGGRFGIKVVGAPNAVKLKITDNQFDCISVPVSIEGLSNFEISDNVFLRVNEWGNQIISTGDLFNFNTSKSNNYIKNDVGILCHFDNGSYNFVENCFQSPNENDFMLNGQGPPPLTGRIFPVVGFPNARSASNYFTNSYSTRSIRLSGFADQFRYVVTQGTPLNDKTRAQYNGEELTGAFHIASDCSPANLSCVVPAPRGRRISTFNEKNQFITEEPKTYNKNKMLNEISTIEQSIKREKGTLEQHLINQMENEIIALKGEIIFNEIKNGNGVEIIKDFKDDKFFNNVLILSALIDNEKYEEAEAFRRAINTEDEFEKDYLYTQSINIARLINISYKADEGVLQDLYEITKKYSPYSAFAHSLYNFFTERTIPFEYENQFIEENISMRESVKDIKLYPNPVQDQIFFSNIEKDEKYQISITSTDGRTINKINSLNAGLDISTLVPGLYYINIRLNNVDIYSTKFVKI